MYLDENGDPIENPEYLNDYGELPGDPRARIPPEVVTEAVPTSWVESMFPRASAAINEGRGAGWSSAMDVYSLPWRAATAGVQTGAQALGAALDGSQNDQETFRDALGRTGGSPQDPGWAQAVDRLARAPENTFLAPAGMTSAALPAWLAKFAPAWVRGAAAGVELGANTGSRSMKAVQGATKAAPASAVIGAFAQGERISSGRPVSPMEAAFLTGLGMIGGGLGPVMEAGGSGLQNLSGKYLTTVIKPTDKARAAGWNPTQLMGELANESSIGYVPLTLGGMRNEAQNAITSRAAARPAAIAADEAEALAAGITPRVNLRRAYAMGARDLEEGLADQSLTGAVQSVPSAQAWLKRNLQVHPAESGPALLTDYTSIENALNARRGIDEFAFVPNAKGVSAAREIAAKGARREINRQLDKFAPRTRAVDASLAPLMANAEGLGIVGERRLNNAFINPMDVATGVVAGGATGNATNGLLAALALRALRTPAPASIGYMLGSGLGGLGRNLPARGTVALPILAKPATDNAR